MRPRRKKAIFKVVGKKKRGMLQSQGEHIHAKTGRCSFLTKIFLEKAAEMGGGSRRFVFACPRCRLDPRSPWGLDSNRGVVTDTSLPSVYFHYRHFLLAKGSGVIAFGLYFSSPKLLAAKSFSIDTQSALHVLEFKNTRKNTLKHHSKTLMKPGLKKMLTRYSPKNGSSTTALGLGGQFG